MIIQRVVAAKRMSDGKSSNPNLQNRTDIVKVPAIHIFWFNHINGSSNDYPNGKIKNITDDISPIAASDLIDIKAGQIGKSQDGYYYDG